MVRVASALGFVLMAASAFTLSNAKLIYKVCDENVGRRTSVFFGAFIYTVCTTVARACILREPRAFNQYNNLQIRFMCGVVCVPHDA